MTSRTGQRVLFALLLASWPMKTGAQSATSVSINPVQSLSFGLLLPGHREAVRVTDVARRGVVALSGNGPGLMFGDAKIEIARLVHGGSFSRKSGFPGLGNYTGNSSPDETGIRQRNCAA